MTDDQQWGAPQQGQPQPGQPPQGQPQQWGQPQPGQPQQWGAPRPPQPQGPPSWGPPQPQGPPSWGPPTAAQWGAPGPSGGPGAGWAPPPKPGLIPLRPLGLGTILGASFLVMRRNPMPTFGLALLLNLGVVLSSGALIGVVAFLTFGRSQQAGSGDVDAIVAGGYVAGALSLLVVAALNLIASAIVQGVLSQEIARGTVGERLTTRGLWRRLRGRVGALIGWSALISLAALVGIGIVAGLVVALALLGSDATGAAVLVGIVGGLAFVVGAVWLGIKTCMVPAAICLERLPLRQAIVRSWRLTDRSFWKTFGIIALVYVMYSVASQVIVTPVSFIASFGVSFLTVGGDEQSAVVGIIVLYLLLFLVSSLVSAIGIVMLSSTVTLLYIDLRMRKEGLDLELVRFVESRAAAAAGSSTAPVADPYLPPQAGAPAGASPPGTAAPGATWA